MIIRSLLIFCLFIPTVSAIQKEQVKLITVEYPPYISEHVDGYGDVFKLISEYAAENLIVDISPNFLPPARAQKMIEDGNWCLSTYSIRLKGTDAKFITLSDETVTLTLIRLTQSEKFQWTELSELKGKRVAMLRSYTKGLLQTNFTEAGLDIVSVGTIEQGLSMLLLNRVDLVFGDQKIITNSKFGQENKAKLQISETSLHEAKIGFFYNIDCEKKIFGPTPH